jgi:hypothetical protein
LIFLEGECCSQGKDTRRVIGGISFWVKDDKSAWCNADVIVHFKI